MEIPLRSWLTMADSIQCWDCPFKFQDLYRGHNSSRNKGFIWLWSDSWMQFWQPRCDRIYFLRNWIITDRDFCARCARYILILSPVNNRLTQEVGQSGSCPSSGIKYPVKSGKSQILGVLLLLLVALGDKYLKNLGNFLGVYPPSPIPLLIPS